MKRLVLVLVGLALLVGPATGGASPGLSAVAGVAFDPANFTRSEKVDNKWLPLKPGTELVYTGSSADGKKRLVFTVTDLVKVVGGVRNVVVWDRDYTNGELVEAELAFFAQDDFGNVWHTGEYPEEYQGGKVVGAPAWTDHAQVYKLGEKNCVPLRCYTNVLTTREFNLEERGRFQLKYYAAGVGNTRVGWLGKDQDKEAVALVKLVHLSPAALARARAAALELEARAYKTKPAVYGGTPHATRS
jgi:hypothetical protein